jgi:hypothetical protein
MYQLETIADLIQTANLGQLGQDMFLYHSPAEVESCIIVYPSNDPPAIDPDLPKYYIAKFQTIVRAKKHDVGLALCKSLSDTLTRHNLDTPEMFIKTIRPLYQPRVYRRSDSGVLEMSVSYEVRYVDKT